MTRRGGVRVGCRRVRLRDAHVLVQASKHVLVPDSSGQWFTRITQYGAKHVAVAHTPPNHHTAARTMAHQRPHIMAHQRPHIAACNRLPSLEALLTAGSYRAEYEHALHQCGPMRYLMTLHNETYERRARALGTV